MSIFRKLSGLYHWHMTRNMSNTNREIYYLERVIDKTNIRINELIGSWPNGACCPNCYWGATLSVLQDKQERRIERLAQLVIRKERSNGKSISK